MTVIPLEIFAIYFSPYSAHVIEVDHEIYPTVEHAYQCSRYTDNQIKEEIKSARSPVKAWETSTKYKHLQVAEFKNPLYKLQVMKKLMRLKVDQHEEVRRALIESKQQLIVKHITTYPPGDGFWDDGPDGTGLNYIGKMWMEIRNEIQI